MKAIKRLTTFFFAFVIVLVLIPISNVNAAITDINIISETKVTVKQAEDWAKSKGATNTFVGLAALYWKHAPDHGNVNPAVAYVQAAKETGFGNFGGILDESYKNPCGMKTVIGGSDLDSNAHQKFNTWDEGVQAHLDHLALYAGASGYPRSTTYDPRHFITIKGKAVTVNALSGKWAPSLTYGEEVIKFYNDLLVTSGLESKTQTTSSGPTGAIATEPIKKLSDDNINISSPIGWKLENGNWYYYRSNGSKATGWIKPDNNWYYLYGNGVMAKGWAISEGKWYYLKLSGAMQFGWLKDNSNWYYLQGDGSMTTGLKLIDGKKYYLYSNGSMGTGWISMGGQWYYFNSGGDMMTGWTKVDGSWYYLYSSGIMATGWLKIDDNWYYLKSNGARATGWIADGKDYYYLNPATGIMMKDTIINGWQIGIDGKRGSRVPGSTEGKVIVLDPGHNFGGDDGAYATHNGITYAERDLNMQVADKLKIKLEALGYTVIMTRNASDRETISVTQSLTNRVNIANNANADLFVSLHHNSASSATANGVEVYYSSKAQDTSFGGAYSDYKLSTSMSLASTVASSITESTGAPNRGARDSNYFVCRNTSMPAILIEFGFITNSSEAQKCASSSYQDLEATAVASAIGAAF